MLLPKSKFKFGLNTHVEPGRQKKTNANTIKSNAKNNIIMILIYINISLNTAARLST